MRELIRTLLGILLIAGIAFGIGFGYGRRTARNEPETPIISKADTSSSVEPFEVERPKIKDSTVIHHVWVKVPIVPASPVSVPDDAVSVPDSAFVDVPIERKVYQEDSLYRAVVSGPRIGKAGPSLDTLMVYPKTTTITIREKVPVHDRSRWGIAIQAGAGATRNGLTPYVGVGISYNLLTW